MNVVFTNFEKHCKHLKIEANDKDHLIKRDSGQNKSEPTHASNKLENMSTCLRLLFHLNIV
jgi:hypothetical protein